MVKFNLREVERQTLSFETFFSEEIDSRLIVIDSLIKTYDSHF